MKYLSGATGYTKLKNNSKEVILFSDIHDGVNYCKKSSDHINISDYLNLNSEKNQIILEESINDPKLNLTDLWPNAFHTRNLKKLKEENLNIIPVDIRPYLIPFSWQLAKHNKLYKKLPIKKYLDCLFKFFNKDGDIYRKYIHSYIEYINDNNKKKILKIFNDIKDNFLVLYNKYNNETIETILKVKKDEDFFYKIEEINSLIMEYYIVLLILSDTRNSIIHTGLAHSTKLKEILKIFDYKIDEENGMTSINNYTGSNRTNACTINPDNNKYISNKKSIFI